MRVAAPGVEMYFVIANGFPSMTETRIGWPFHRPLRRL